MRIYRWSFLPLLLAGACIAVDCPAQQPAPCSAPQHRQFDFWIGDWEVKNAAGNVTGTNRIESILGGCVIRENWQGTQGPSGTSLNLYAPDGEWPREWVDSQGNLLELHGGLEEGKMVMREPSRLRGTLARPSFTGLPGRLSTAGASASSGRRPATTAKPGACSLTGSTRARVEAAAGGGRPRYRELAPAGFVEATMDHPWRKAV